MLQIQNDLDRAAKTITQLQEQKYRLKAALSETIQKRDGLFKEANYLYRLLNEAKTQRNEPDTLEQNQELLGQLRTGILKRDQIINELRARAKGRGNEVALCIPELIATARVNTAVYSTLKKHLGCCKALEEQVSSGDLTVPFLKIVAFAQELASSLSAEGPQVLRTTRSEGSRLEDKLSLESPLSECLLVENTVQRPARALDPSKSASRIPRVNSDNK